MSEDRDRLLGKDEPEQADDDVEAHRLVAKDSTIEDNDDDDVEAHRLVAKDSTNDDGDDDVEAHRLQA